MLRGSDGSFSPVGNASEIPSKRLELIVSASHELFLLLPGNSKRFVQANMAIAAAVKRGVKVRILISDSESLSVNGAEVRRIYGDTRSQKIELALADGRSCLVSETIGEPKSQFGFVTTDRAFVQAFAGLYENLWDQAVAYDKFKEADRIKDSYIEKQHELYDKLREADRLKDDFINIAAHELRTPIMPILGGLELVESKLQGLQEQEAKLAGDRKALE